MSLRVVYVLEDMGVGGIERAVQGWASRARAAGVDARVLCTRAGGAVAEELRAQGVPVDILQEANFVAVTRALRGGPRLVVHTQGVARTIGRLAGRLAGAAGIVHHLHGTEAFGLKQRLFERTLPADRYLAVSSHVRDDFQRQVGVPRVEVHYSGVDLERFRFQDESRSACRRELGLSAEAPVLMSVGRLVADKGHRFAVEALRFILGRLPGAVLVLIGEGPCRQALEDLARPLGASVRLLGARADVAPYLSACDVFVQPSLRREGMGLAVAEAMACGRAVVASSIEGLPEVVGNAGLLVPAADAGAIAAAALSLLGEGGRRQELGERARRRSETMFSARGDLAELLRTYRSLGS